MRQHVSEPTHVGGHTLDVVITRDTDNTVSDIEVTDPGLSDNTGKASRDHFAVFFNTRAFKPAPVTKTVSFRKLHSIDVDAFKNDILTSDILKSSLQFTNTEELVSVYNDELLSLINKHAPLLLCSSAPLRTKAIVLRPSCPWYTGDLHVAKHMR